MKRKFLLFALIILTYFDTISMAEQKKISADNLPVRIGSPEYYQIIAASVGSETEPIDLAVPVQQSNSKSLRSVVLSETQGQKSSFNAQKQVINHSNDIVGTTAAQGIEALSKILKPGISVQTSNGRPYARTKVEIALLEEASITLIQKFKKSGPSASGILTLPATSSCRVETWAPFESATEYVEVTLNCKITESTLKDVSPTVKKIVSWLKIVPQ